MPKFKQRTDKELINPIYVFRAYKQWSLAEMAKRLKISRQLLYMWETGQCKPKSDKHLKDLKELTKITLEELEKWDEFRN